MNWAGVVAAPESPFWLQSYCKSPLDGTGQCQIDLYQIILGTRNLAFSNGQGNFLNRNLPYSPECGLGAECQGCFIQTDLSLCKRWAPGTLDMWLLGWCFLYAWEHAEELTAVISLGRLLSTSLCFSSPITFKDRNDTFCIHLLREFQLGGYGQFCICGS